MSEDCKWVKVIERTDEVCGVDGCMDHNHEEWCLTHKDGKHD